MKHFQSCGFDDFNNSGIVKIINIRKYPSILQCKLKESVYIDNHMFEIVKKSKINNFIKIHVKVPSFNSIVENL